MGQFVDLAEFKRQARDGKAPERSPLIKQFTVDVAKGIEETKDGLLVPFIISTAAVDRQNDSIDPNGWRLENYQKNPVVLWVHDSRQPPVAMAVSIGVEDDKLKSTAQFATAELYPFGYMIGQMYAKGFLHAVSVGFNPIKYAWVEDKDRPWGIDFQEQELLEYSACPVPANPEALVDAKVAGIDTTPLLEWAVKVLDGVGAGLSQAQAEKVYQVLREHKTFSIPGVKAEQTDNGLLSLWQLKVKINKNRGLNT